MFWNSLHHHYIGQRADHFGAAPSPLASYHQTLPGVLINQIQHPHCSSVMRLRTDEVVAPHMALALRPQPYARAIVEPQPPSWLLHLRNLQPLAPPVSLASTLPTPPPRSPQQRRDAPVAI